MASGGRSRIERQPAPPHWWESHQCHPTRIDADQSAASAAIGATRDGTIAARATPIV
jgi:hypothetical protein